MQQLSYLLYIFISSFIKKKSSSYKFKQQISIHLLQALTCKPTSSDYQEIIYRVWTITKKIKALINNYATKFELFINHYNIYC